MKGSFYILGVKLDDLDISSSVTAIEEWIKTGRSIPAKYVCVTNVNSVVEAQKDGFLKKITNESDLSVCDGMPLVWLAKMTGGKLRERVYGLSLMNRVLAVSEKKGYSHYFYGSTDSVLQNMIRNIKVKYPSLKIKGSYSPPFRKLTQEEDDIIVSDINNSGADIVWIGLGYPKQEIWMYEFGKFIKCPVLIGVGAAFDFLAGNKAQAPRWMQNSGLEWLFRLLSEPRRLWRRYLINNTLFILFLFKELIFLKSPLKAEHLPRQKEV